MKFVLLTVKSTKPSWVKVGIEDYLKKIDPLQKIEMLEVPGASSSRESSEVKKRLESKSLADALKADDFVILFDERGQNFDSMQFSKKINQILMSGKKRAVFVIGGAYGVDEQVAGRAQVNATLAPFVLNHWIAQLVTLEQIFRGLSILKSLPYHNS